MTDMIVPSELKKHIRTVLSKGISPEVVCTLIAYYAANRPEDSDWVILPVASFDAYFGIISLGWMIPGEVLERLDGFFDINQLTFQPVHAGLDGHDVAFLLLSNRLELDKCLGKAN